jgi:hypothetical protein
MNDGLEQNLLSLPDYALNSEVKDLKTRVDDRISIGLQYACQSWNNHLTKIGDDVANVISYLHIFLEEKFLAWLEVVSALGVTRGAIFALEQLMPWLQEVCFGLSAALSDANICNKSGCQGQGALQSFWRLFQFCDQVL